METKEARNYTSLLVLLLCGQLLVAFMLYVNGTQTQQLGLKFPSKFQTYEYKVTAIPDERLDADLATLGAERWQIVSARRATNAAGVPSYEFVFVRTKTW